MVRPVLAVVPSCVVGAGPLAAVVGLLAGSFTAVCVMTTALLAWPADAGAADAVRGQSLYESRCGACHSIVVHRIGPRHQGVIGRKAGSEPGYDYSDALRASNLVWDTALIARWLENPEKLIPGQRMGYSLGDAAERADIAEYLARQGRPR